MTPIEVYDSFIIKVNENAQTDNIAVDEGRFVYLFNEASNKYVEWILEKRNEDDVNYLNPILKTEEIDESVVKKKYQLFKFPKDYFDISNVSGVASSDCCKKVQMYMFSIKSENEGEVITNELYKPSIEYREAPYYLQNKSVKVFTDNFKVDIISLTYYKYPQKIQLQDEEDPESGFLNEDKELEFDNKVLDRIISIAASDNSLNTSNPKFQADKTRVVSKF